MWTRPASLPGSWPRRREQGGACMTPAWAARFLEPAFADATRDVVGRLPYPCAVVWRDGRMAFANDAFRSAFKLETESIEGCSVFEVAGGGFDLPELRELLDKSAQQGPVHRARLDHDFPGV